MTTVGTHGTLADRTVALGRALQAAGVNVSLSEIIDATRATTAIDLAQFQVDERREVRGVGGHPEQHGIAGVGARRRGAGDGERRAASDREATAALSEEERQQLLQLLHKIYRQDSNATG